MALELFANFERTSNNTVFYRVANPTPYLYPVTFRLNDLTDSTFYLTSANYLAAYSFNNQPFIPFTTTFSLASSLYVPSTPNAYSFTVRVSSASTQQLLSTFQISAAFVSSFLSASTFIAYPSAYFIDAYVRTNLLANEIFEYSPGMAFYGEGHTEYFYLSTHLQPNVTRYVWKFGDFTNSYTPLISSANPQTTLALATITSDHGFYPTIPIQLQATNSTFTSSAPGFWFDDVTGESKQYPWFVSTVDYYGNELDPNNKLKQSITVLPYDGSPFILRPGVPGVVYLPLNGLPVFYRASFQIALTGGFEALSACYQKYGELWKWSTFELCPFTENYIDSPELWYTNCAPFTAETVSTFYGRPSSWNTVQCIVSAGSTINDIPGPFPKKWIYEPPNNSPKSPVICTASTAAWTLSTDKSVSTVTRYIDDPSLSGAWLYDFSLQLSGYGVTPIQNLSGIIAAPVSFYDITQVLIQVDVPVTCQISAEPFDWKPKTSTVTAQHITRSIPPPEPRFYTSNRFMLTGTDVVFENVTSRQNLLSTLTINFDDERPSINFTSFPTPRTFITSYSSVGLKTITLQGYTVYDPVTPITTVLPGVIEILDQYDDVRPENYRSIQTPIELPYPKKIQIAANDWVVADVFNSCMEKFYKNLEYLESRGFVYTGSYSDYFGWLGPRSLTLVPGLLSACPQYTWEDINCNIPTNDQITWIDMSATDTFTGIHANCGTWLQQTCGTKKISPTCNGLYGLNWDWKSRKEANAEAPIVWRQTRCSSGAYPKRWYYEPSEDIQILVCDEGIWNVNIPKINQFYSANEVTNCRVQRQCVYQGVASRNNILFAAQTTQIRVLSSDYSAEFFSYENLFDDVTALSNIKNICIDSEGKIIVLDSDLVQVAIYKIVDGKIWEPFITWGGVGTANSRNRFFAPNDVHVDQFDNIWVTDSGNKCVKKYSNTGTWLNTIQNTEFTETPPISICIDSQNNIHVLTNKEIIVYNNTGTYLYSYDYKQFVSGQVVRINSSYNREVIYLCTDTQVVKFFRNGVFNGYIIQEQGCVNNITSVYQDEFRNLLVTSNDKILKFPDLMTLTNLKGQLPSYYWKLEDLYIHPDEYVQNWVYNKALQRLWDNIEMFRSTLLYTDNTPCSKYRSPKYQKNEIVIGQNEIVTSVVVNRALSYLWENFITLIDPLDPSCPERLRT
jgi:hypothetical protein